MLEFSPVNPILIMDDGSDRGDQQELLSSLEAHGLTVWRANTDGERGAHGGLYNNMNNAIRYANHMCFNYIHLLQDDMQFVCDPDESFAEAFRLFHSSENILQVCVVFQKLIDGSRNTICDELGCYINPESGIFDTGIVDVARFVEAGLTFGPTEGEAGRRAKLKGFKTAFVPAPSLAWIPWVPYFREGKGNRPDSDSKRIGKHACARCHLKLAPLSTESLTSLRRQSLNRAPFHEDYVHPNNWTCPYPYVFRRSWRRWVKRFVKAALQGRLRWSDLRIAVWALVLYLKSYVKRS
jgi:hypothetical protein